MRTVPSNASKVRNSQTLPATRADRRQASPLQSIRRPILRIRRQVRYHPDTKYLRMKVGCIRLFPDKGIVRPSSGHATQAATEWEIRDGLISPSDRRSATAKVRCEDSSRDTKIHSCRVSASRTPTYHLGGAKLGRYHIVPDAEYRIGSRNLSTGPWKCVRDLDRLSIAILRLTPGGWTG